jgi:hypothetical protein
MPTARSSDGLDLSSKPRDAFHAHIFPPTKKSSKMWYTTTCLFAFYASLVVVLADKRERRDHRHLKGMGKGMMMGGKKQSKLTKMTMPKGENNARKATFEPGSFSWGYYIRE